MIPQFQLKPLSQEGIPAALEKAMRYRLLNEPAEAESICLDILAADPDNQEAIVILILAITDRFSRGYYVSDTHAQELINRLASPYERCYYSGIIAERRAKAQLNNGGSHASCEWLMEAMEWFEKAEALRPHGNDDALLRWNTCARIIARNKLSPPPEKSLEPALE